MPDLFSTRRRTVRGVPMGAVILGLHRASEQARRQLGLTRWPDPVLPAAPERGRGAADIGGGPAHREYFIGVGLDSSNATTRQPSSSVCLPGHARWACAWWRMPSEEGPAAYVEQALDLLQAERIDHGVRSIDDPL